MEPAGSPWSYAYNRIVPSSSASSSGEEFQHPHLATITAAAAGQSAQSLLLQAAHAGFNASANSFVSPSPIASYNPVFSQIYHHAAAASGNVQPKPAHYSSNNISTSSHRQAHIAAIEKIDPQNNFQHQNQSPSTYYGENSSSSGASPSPTTSAITSTSLSWNSPAQFIAIQQQQQQLHHQQQIQQLNEKVI